MVSELSKVPMIGWDRPVIRYLYRVVASISTLLLLTAAIIRCISSEPTADRYLMWVVISLPYINLSSYFASKLSEDLGRPLSIREELAVWIVPALALAFLSFGLSYEWTIRRIAIDFLGFLFCGGFQFEGWLLGRKRNNPTRDADAK